jgi:hypothetical protein
VPRTTRVTLTLAGHHHKLSVIVLLVCANEEPLNRLRTPFTQQDFVSFRHVLSIRQRQGLTSSISVQC